MDNSFEKLIENFGVPRIVIANSPFILSFGDGAWRVGDNPEKEPSGRVYQRRFRCGDAEFLAVRSRIEADLSEESELLKYLREKDQRPIEFLYDYEKRSGATVAVTSDADAAPLGRRELTWAADEKRLIWVSSWSSMGDAYLDVSHCTEPFFPEPHRDNGLYFLFAAPRPILPEMLVGIGENFDRGNDLWSFCARDHFFRSFWAER